MPKEILKPAEEMFCQLYAGSSPYFNNATRAYAVAYKYDIWDEPRNKKERRALARKLRVCTSMSSKLTYKFQ